MKKALVFFFSFLSLSNADSVFSKIPDSAASIFIFSVQKQMLNDKFDSALTLCDSFITLNSGSPIGYLFKAGTFLGEMSDCEEGRFSAELRKLADTAIILCDKELENSIGTDAAYLYLWRGHAHVYRSLFESRFGSLTSAIKNGLRAHDDFQSGLLHDSALSDLYFGLGNYHYWKSAKAGILRTFGIIDDDIEKGIEELKLTIASGQYFPDAARNSLIWIYLDKQEYNLAIVLAENALANYPDSRTIRWPLAAAYFEKEEFENSAKIYGYLHEYFGDHTGNYFNLIECDYKLYQCYKKLGWEDESTKLLNSVSAYRSQVPRATQHRQLAKLNYLRRELAR